jgi:hypothetical protein
MAEKTIRHAFFRYRKPLVVDGEKVVDDKGGPVYVEQLAYRGDTLDIPLKDDVEFGEKWGAFETAETLASVSVADRSDEELAAWLENEKPTVDETVAAAGDDPVLASGSSTPRTRPTARVRGRPKASRRSPRRGRRSRWRAVP